LSRNPQNSAVSLKQFALSKGKFLIKHKFNLNRSSCIAIDNVLLLPKIYVFGTGITLFGRAYPNQAEIGLCRIHLYAGLWSLGIKLSDPAQSLLRLSKITPRHFTRFSKGMYHRFDVK
jgi:hypothetical protein